MINGNLQVVSAHTPAFMLGDNNPHTMWVDYDAQNKMLRVFLAQDPSSPKPVLPVIELPMSLVDTVKSSSVFLGFTAATGGLMNTQQIDDWSFAAGSSPQVNSDRLGLDQQLFPGNALRSADGRFVAAMMQDGRFAVYQSQNGDWQQLWSSGTAGRPAARVIMQTDGNLVLYGLDGVAYWSSRTWGTGASTTLMQNDGNLVTYTPTGTPKWASGTAGH